MLRPVIAAAAMNVPASINGDMHNAYLLEGRAFLHQGRVKVFWMLTNEQGRTARIVSIEIPITSKPSRASTGSTGPRTCSSWSCTS